MQELSNGYYRMTAEKYVSNNRNSSIMRVQSALKEMESCSDPFISDILYYLAYDKNGGILYFQDEKRTDYYSSFSSDEGKYTIKTNFMKDKQSSDFKNIGVTDFEIVVHETKHAYDRKKGNTSGNPERAKYTDNGIELGEVWAIQMENRARRLHGRKIRTTYAGKQIPNKYLQK